MVPPGLLQTPVSPLIVRRARERAAGILPERGLSSWSEESITYGSLADVGYVLS